MGKLSRRASQIKMPFRRHYQKQDKTDRDLNDMVDMLKAYFAEKEKEIPMSERTDADKIEHLFDEIYKLRKWLDWKFKRIDYKAEVRDCWIIPSQEKIPIQEY